MPETTNYEKRKKIVKLLTAFYLILLGIMVLFNAGNSLLRTTYFDLYKDMETARSNPSADRNRNCLISPIQTVGNGMVSADREIVSDSVAVWNGSKSCDRTACQGNGNL